MAKNALAAERAALLAPNVAGNPQAAGTEAAAKIENQVAQELLGALGGFQQSISEAESGGLGSLWSDECMNFLIQSAEIALANGWSEAVEALTEIGRVLQSYENGGRPEDCIEFLQGSYDVMCRMAGDVESGAVSSSTLEQWKELHANALDEMKSAGVALVDDEGEEANSAGGGAAMSTDSSENEIPFDMPEADASSTDEASSSDELPTLDELPPLESMVEMGVESGRVSEPEPVAETSPNDDEELELVSSAEEIEESTVTEDESVDEQAEELPEPLEISTAGEPPRIVVDIIDRLSEEFIEVDSLEGDGLDSALETIQGGLIALQREAQDHEQQTAKDLCAVMLDIATSCGSGKLPIDDRFTDLGFAFCGLYVEAGKDGESQNVLDWKNDCSEFVESGQAAPEPPAEEAPPADAIAEVAAPQAAPAAPTLHVIEADGTKRPVEIVEPESSAAVESSLSAQNLLVSAQQTASSGDGAGAIVLALQAAADIAKAEVFKAEQTLSNSEERLKQNINSIEASRATVQEAEGRLMNSSTQVATGEKQLGAAKEHGAQVAQNLEDLEEKASDLDRQIRELQARRESELGNVEGTKRKLDEASLAEKTAEESLAQLRRSEDEYRLQLESSRQRVKDMQRTTLQIESEMERAREDLTTQKISHADISQTIQQISGKKEDRGEKSDPMLF